MIGPGTRGNETSQGKARAVSDLKTVAFTRKVEMSFAHPCEEVTLLFEPDGRSLLYPWWKPEISVHPTGNRLAGMVQKVTPPPLTDGWGLVLTVHEHKPDPQNWEIYYSVFWGDYELQQIRVTCRPNASGGTDATWEENTIGFGDHGVVPVAEFVSTETLQARVNGYRNAIDAHLKGEDPGVFIGHLQSFDDGVVPRNG